LGLLGYNLNEYDEDVDELSDIAVDESQEVADEVTRAIEEQDYKNLSKALKDYNDTYNAAGKKGIEAASSAGSVLETTTGGATPKNTIEAAMSIATDLATKKALADAEKKRQDKQRQTLAAQKNPNNLNLVAMVRQIKKMMRLKSKDYAILSCAVLVAVLYFCFQDYIEFGARWVMSDKLVKIGDQKKYNVTTPPFFIHIDEGRDNVVTFKGPRSWRYRTYILTDPSKYEILMSENRRLLNELGYASSEEVQVTENCVFLRGEESRSNGLVSKGSLVNFKSRLIIFIKNSNEMKDEYSDNAALCNLNLENVGG